MLPEIKGTIISHSDAALPNLAFGEVLDYYDGPRLLLERGPDGQIYLAWWNDCDDAVARWLCIPLSRPRLHAVLSGQIPARAAMEHPEDGYLLVIDIDLDTDTIARAVKTTAAAIPQHTLPHPEATLNIPLPASVRNAGNENKTDPHTAPPPPSQPVPGSTATASA